MNFKKSFILWFSSFILLFLINYFKAVSSINYPTSGTISIDGEKITFKFDKEGFGQTKEILIRTDLKDLRVFCLIEKVNSIDTIIFNQSNGYYKVLLDRRKTGDYFKYKVLLLKDDLIREIPFNSYVTFQFYGKISGMLSAIYNLFLFIGLLLTIRSGLEFFKGNILTKKLLLLSGVVWLTFVVLINPLYLSYKYEYINHIISPIGKLFPLEFVIIFVITLLTIFLEFNKSNQQRPISLISALIIIILYLVS